MSGLVGHSQNQGLGRALPLLERCATPPPYWVALDPDPYDALRASLYTRLVVRRHYRFDFGDGAVAACVAAGVTPEQAAQEFVHSCMAQQWWPSAWAVMTPPAMAGHWSPPDVLAWAIEFQSACVQLFAASRRECFVCNVPTGNDGYHVPGARFYIAQEYTWPGGVNDLHRYRMWFEGRVLPHQPDAKLLIGECGVTALQATPRPQPDGSAPHGPDIGWRGGYGVPGIGVTAYTGILSGYREGLRADPYVLAAAVYEYGGNPDWESFESLGEPEVEDLITGQTWEARGNAPVDAPAPNLSDEGADMTEAITAPLLLGAGILAKAQELGADVTGAQLTGELYLKDGQGQDTYSYALFERCELRYYPAIGRVFAVPFL